jgi:eukaryotic-like serine/threonine-protein kinase
MSHVQTCCQCGVRLPADAPPGICPKCALRRALTVDDDASADIPFDGEFAETEVSRDSSALDVSLQGAQRFGDYELLEEIARGGMGIVYRARQLSLDRVVALKLLPFSALTTAEFIKRFRAEASAAAALKHPNIVMVHDVGVHQGQHYLVMDFINGPPMSRLVSNGPLPAKRAATYLKLIAQAVHYAHEHGILHRDLKPSNVLIDEDDQPQVTDFGLAKRLDGESSLTLTGQALGSPGYMPPEQASADHRKVTRRSDVYGLGAMLYHLLTGRPPFQASTLNEAIQQVVDKDPLTPRLLNPSVPRDLETICLKCLEKESERRYPTAQAVADELERFLKGEPILARPVGLAGKAWRWCRRKPVVASLGAAVILLLLMLAIGGPLLAAHQRALAERYRKLSYAAELTAAWQAWDGGNVDRCIELLDHHRPQPGQSDLREFTWRLLWNLCQPALETPAATNPAPVLLSAVSRDGQRFALSGPVGSVSIWNATSRQLEREIRTGDAFAGGVAFSPDGRLLVTTGRSIGGYNYPGAFRVWDVRSGAKAFEPDFANGQGHAGDFSPDGRWFALDVTNAIALLDVAHGWEERRQLRGHTHRIWQISWCPTGERLVSVSADKIARIWNAATGEELGQLQGHSDVVRNAIFSPDGRIIATGSLDGTLRLWDAETFVELEERYQPSGPVMGLAFSRNGRWLAAGSHFDGRVTLIDLNAQRQRTLRAQFRSVKAVPFVLEDTVLVTAGLDQTIRFWDLTRLPPADVFEGPTKGASPVAFSSDSQVLATVSSNGTAILLWNVATGARQAELRLPVPDPRSTSSPAELVETGIASVLETSVKDLWFTPDGTLVVARAFKFGAEPQATNWQHRIELHDVRRKVLLESFPGRSPVACSPDGSQIATRTVEDGSVQLRLLARPNGTSPGRPSSVLAWVEQQNDRSVKRRQVLTLAFSPNGTILAASGGTDRAEGELVLFDARSGRRLATLRSRSSIQPPTYAMAFTPDGTRLVTGGLGTKVQFWNVAGGRLVDEWVGHSAYIVSLAISPDGKTLATGSGKGLIKLWSLEQRAELLTLPAHERQVDALRFSSDGQVLASSGQDGRVRLWRAEAGP